MNNLNIDKFEYINCHTHGKDISQEVFSLVNIFPDYIYEVEEDNEYMRYSVGLHPWYIEESKAKLMIENIKKIASHKNVLAIGETGLDKRCETNFEDQLKYFKLQLKIAEEVQKPVIIHNVKSLPEILALEKILKPTVPWILHGYRGSIQATEQLILKGFYFSFCDNITKDEKIAEVLKIIPDNKLFFENDDTDVDTKSIYKDASLIRDQEISYLQKITKNNFISLFGK